MLTRKTVARNLPSSGSAYRYSSAFSTSLAAEDAHTVLVAVQRSRYVTCSVFEAQGHGRPTMIMAEVEPLEVRPRLNSASPGYPAGIRQHKVSLSMDAPYYSRDTTASRSLHVKDPSHFSSTTLETSQPAQDVSQAAEQEDMDALQNAVEHNTRQLHNDPVNAFTTQPSSKRKRGDAQDLRFTDYEPTEARFVRRKRSPAPQHEDPAGDAADAPGPFIQPDLHLTGDQDQSQGQDQNENRSHDQQHLHAKPHDRRSISPDLVYSDFDPRANGLYSAAALFRRPPPTARKPTRPPMSKLFASLSLPPERFLILQSAAKAYMLDPACPERRACVGNRGRDEGDMVKFRLYNCVKQFLVEEGRGEEFFGVGVKGRRREDGAGRGMETGLLGS
ncbi:hypothetical protein MRB53_037019 [Persea americana]|nr:hypothetical protein MRB53_037019 [Persea americana]